MIFPKKARWDAVAFVANRQGNERCFVGSIETVRKKLNINELTRLTMTGVDDNQSS